MSLTLEMALSLDIFKNAEVLCGSRNLNRAISFITVMEVPDICDWVHAGELVLTTGYPFKDSPIKLANLVSQLCEKKVCGIAIKTKRFIDEIPQEVLDIAEELGFPVILLPPDTRFSAIISHLMGHMLNEAYFEKRLKVDFLNDLVSGSFSDENDINKRAKGLGINVNIPYSVYVFDWAEITDSGNDTDYSIKVGRLEQLVHDVFASYGLKIVCWAHLDKVNVLVPMKTEKIDAKAQTIATVNLAWQRLNEMVADFALIVGIGNPCPRIFNLHKSYEEASQAVQLCRAISKEPGVYHYDDIGIYQLLMPLSKSETAKKYVDSHLGKLIRHDKKRNAQLLSTLECYLASGNVEKTAKQLYIHPKTLILRREKIEEILGMSLKSEENKLLLLAAVKLHRLNK